MRKESKALLGKHNFKAFQATEERIRNSIRYIKSIKIIKKGNFIYFDFEAKSFLYNMVRNITGTLLEFGRGKFEPGSMKKILKMRDRCLAGPTLPAKGLCLVKVKYR